MLTISLQDGLLVAMDNLIGEGMLLNPSGLEVELFTSTTRPISSDSDEFDYGDLQVPSYNDYAPGTIDSWTIAIQGNGATAISAAVSFIPGDTGDNDSSEIVGYALTTGGETPTLIAAEEFEGGSVTLKNPTDELILHAKVKLPSLSDYGTCSVV